MEKTGISFSFYFLDSLYYCLKTPKFLKSLKILFKELLNVAIMIKQRRGNKTEHKNLIEINIL